MLYYDNISPAVMELTWNMLSITMLPCSIGGNCLLALDECGLPTEEQSTPVEYTASAISLVARIAMASVMNSRTDNVTSSVAVTCRFAPNRMAASVLWHVQRKVLCARFGVAATVVALSSGTDADDSGTTANVNDGNGRWCRSVMWCWYGGRVGGSGCTGVAAKKSGYEMTAASPWSTGMHMSDVTFGSREGGFLCTRRVA